MIVNFIAPYTIAREKKPTYAPISSIGIRLNEVFVVIVLLTKAILLLIECWSMATTKGSEWPENRGSRKLT